MNRKTLFASISLLLTFGLIILVVLPEHFKIGFAVFLSALAGFLTLVALRENLSGIEFLTLTALPILFTLGMSGILYHFPNFSIFFRTLFWFLFSFFFYIILLSGNIFNVAAEKPIPLVRASYTASFLVTLFSIFPLYTIVFKSNLDLWLALLLVSVFTFVLTFQSLWTLFLPKPFDPAIIWGSLLVTLVMTEAALSISFLQLESFFRALALSTIYYIVLGFSHHFLKKTLNNKVFWEYILVSLLVSFIIFFF